MFAFSRQAVEHSRSKLETLDVCPHLEDFGDLFPVVNVRLDNQTPIRIEACELYSSTIGKGIPVEEVDRNSMRCLEVVSTSHRSLAAVRGEDNGRCHWRLQQRIQVCETLDVEHVYLSTAKLNARVYEERAGLTYLVN